MVTIGRVSSALVMILAILWSTRGGLFSSIFAAINVIASDLAPPITTVFLFGVFWRRGTKEASAITLVSGLCMGILAFLFGLPVIGHTRLISDGWGVSFLMQAWWMFCICSAIFVVSSLCTPAPPPHCVDGLTWTDPMASLREIRGWRSPPAVALLLLATMIILYVVFR